MKHQLSISHILIILIIFGHHNAFIYIIVHSQRSLIQTEIPEKKNRIIRFKKKITFNAITKEKIHI